MYEIWTSRNNLNYDKTQLSQETIITKILPQIRNILTAHYKLHKLNETLPTFQKLFCINNAIAKIHNSGNFATQIPGRNYTISSRNIAGWTAWKKLHRKCNSYPKKMQFTSVSANYAWANTHGNCFCQNSKYSCCWIRSV